VRAKNGGIVGTAGLARELDQIFANADTNSDGFISGEEFKTACKGFGIADVSDETVSVFMHAFDTNGDGKIDVTEFKAFLADDKSAPQRPPSKKKKADSPRTMMFRRKMSTSGMSPTKSSNADTTSSTPVAPVADVAATATTSATAAIPVTAEIAASEATPAAPTTALLSAAAPETSSIPAPEVQVILVANTADTADKVALLPPLRTHE
jgi:hypothetical protein